MSTESVKIHYFARCRIVTGRQGEEIFLESPVTSAALIEELCRRHPGLQKMFPMTRIAINCEFAGENEWIKPGDEVALIPPVSGGVDDYCRLSNVPIAHDEAVRILPGFCGQNGGLATFSGIVRHHSQGKNVQRLEYEAYAEMALRKMRQICAEAKVKWEVHHIGIVHRVGNLQIGEVAVSIAVFAVHRRPALDACSFVIERLKEDVPIWKCEVSPEGERWWGKGP